VIHIDYRGETPTEEWLRKAELVTQELNDAADSEERSRIIEKNKKLWGELKDWLLSLSHNKCWYTEAFNDSSLYEVEHFRPKKWRQNDEEPEFDGYWWLAFDWENYRICGNAPNRKKGAFFPLHPDSRRASAQKQHLCRDEVFCLLDPTVLADTMLISFNEKGMAIPTPGTMEWDKDRSWGTFVPSLP
jgi:hypothetical protein